MDFASLPSPLWVLGTGTGVGKTHVSARIAQAWAQSGPVTYRKPFQTGVDRADHPEADASVLRAALRTVLRAPGIAVENHTLLKAPLSPLAAALHEGRTIDLADAASWCRRPAEGRVLLEGVGGLMVPLAPQTHFLAWATELRIPCVLVALGGLGTLNHTLLSAEALMLRGWRIEAVLLNPGADNATRPGADDITRPGADGATREAAEENAALLRGFLPLAVEVV